MEIKTQTDFLKYLDIEEIQLFNIETIKKSLKADGRILNEIAEKLVVKGFLHRMERGKYCRATFHDENVVGTFMVADGAVSYWSALHLHGLTEQFSNTVFIQTTKKKRAISVFGTDYQFIKIDPCKRAGILWNGYGNYKYAITDIEKTFVDCFDLPQYCGGYPELIRAFSNSDLNVEKLIKYCNSVNNIAAIKRMGFLANTLNNKNLSAFVNYAKTRINRTYNLLDPFGKSVGKPNSEWFLRLNLTMEELFSINQNLY